MKTKEEIAELKRLHQKDAYKYEKRLIAYILIKKR